MQKVKLFLASIAPGIFLLGYNIGTGSITTMAATGAKYGMSLVWALLLSAIFTYYLVIAFGRYTAVTGETAIASYRKHFGKGLALVVLISIWVSEWIASAGVMGVVAEAIKEWSRPFTSSGEGISTVIVAGGLGGLLYYLFWNGSHRFFEKILGVFVGLMGLSFVLSMLMVIPEPAEILKGMVPKIPQETNAALLIAGMVGTTMGGVLYVVRSILVQERGWKIQDTPTMRRDALVSVSLMFLLSVAVMATAAGTMFPRGLEVGNAIDMVLLLEPIAGRFAVSVFVAGIVAAGLSSLFPHYLLAAWILADYRNEPRDMRSTTTRLLALTVVLLGLVVPIFGGRPVMVMVVSQAMAAIATPVTIILMLLILNKSGIMGEHRATPGSNIILGVIFIFSILVAVIGIVGIKGMF